MPGIATDFTSTAGFHSGNADVYQINLMRFTVKNLSASSEISGS